MIVGPQKQVVDDGRKNGAACHITKMDKNFVLLVIALSAVGVIVNFVAVIFAHHLPHISGN